jgi:hypothetical protein
MAKHSGLHEFSGDESSNLFLGQRGFKIIGHASSDTEIECGSTSGFTDITYFVALKAVDADAVVEARTYGEAKGDDLSKNIVSGVATYNGSSGVTLGNGDIVYGCFDKVDVTGGDYIIAYIGK